MREFPIIVAVIIVAALLWTHLSHGATGKPVGTIPAEPYIAVSKAYASTEYGVVFTCRQFITTKATGQLLITVCQPLKRSTAPAKRHSSSTSHLSA